MYGVGAQAGWRALSSNVDVPLLGLAVAAFESSMHRQLVDFQFCLLREIKLGEVKVEGLWQAQVRFRLQLDSST